MTSQQNQGELSPSTTKLLAALADQFLAAEAAPGVSIAFVKDGRVAHTLQAGFADPQHQVPVSPEHLYEIGSISKSFTALAVLSLVDEGKLALTDTVEQHVPWFEVQSDYPPFTLRHLLDHSSGLIMGSDSWPDELAQVVALRTSHTGSAPDSIFHYSNVGFMTLGVVVSAVAGKPCTQVMSERILNVVGMTDTITTITDHDRPRMAVGTQPVHEDEPWRPGDPLAPATWFEISAVDGNIASTAGMGQVGSSMAYGASKAGVVNLTQNLARALAPHVRVNGVAPGAVDSSWMVEWTPEQKQFSIEKSLLKRRATPNDIAEIVMFLGFSAHMVTGQIIIADAGRGL